MCEGCDRIIKPEIDMSIPQRKNLSFSFDFSPVFL
uniref:Uncharacterized protein n=1 Tax=Anguilla anguilla TaxID=7936 RepID=A0A0E9VX38_ANGAN